MLTIIESSILESKLTTLRDKRTTNALFFKTMNESSYLIAAEVLKYIPMKKILVETPLRKTSGKQMSQRVVLIPILRAGLGLLEGFTKLLPGTEFGHIGLYRDEKTYMPVKYLYTIPQLKNKLLIVLDPMIATGRSSSFAINLLLNSGTKINNIFLVSLLAAPEGIQYLNNHHKTLRIFTVSVDAKLNKQKFIVPGLGDAGDRYMGT